MISLSHQSLLYQMGTYPGKTRVDAIQLWVQEVYHKHLAPGKMPGEKGFTHIGGAMQVFRTNDKEYGRWRDLVELAEQTFTCVHCGKECRGEGKECRGCGGQRCESCKHAADSCRSKSRQAPPACVCKCGEPVFATLTVCLECAREAKRTS